MDHNINLYIGSESRRVYLNETQPQTIFQFKEDSLRSVNSSQAIRSALSYRFGQKFLHPERLGDLLIPCTPATEITEMFDSSAKESVKNKSEFWRFLSLGLIKTPQAPIGSQSEQYVGYKSGKRSAVLVYSGRVYRLKGCGNQDEGFVTQGGVTPYDEHYEIRGCHFYHTVKRELFMTQKIASILQERGVECANKSVGYYEYDPAGLPATIKDMVPQVAKYCGVFETLSDKRVGSHLLQGLQVLLTTLLTLNTKKLDHDELKQLVSVPSRIEQFGFEKQENKWHLSQTYFEFLERDYVQTIDVKGLIINDQFFKEENEKNNLDTLRVLYQTGTGLRFDELSQEQRILLHKILKELNVHEVYHNQFVEQLYQLTTSKQCLEHFFLLYERLGYEMGRVKRIMIESDINWGYYRDHHKDLYHCNAHMNNFLVLPQGHTNLLGCLDYDLAFSKDEFISIEFDQEYIYRVRNKEKLNNLEEPMKDERIAHSYGKFDDEQWNWYINAERQSLEMGLSGIEIIINSLMTEIDFSQYFSSHDIEIQGILETMLRDQMRIGYLQGMRNLPHQNQQMFESLSRELRVLIELSLILTSDIVA